MCKTITDTLAFQGRKVEPCEMVCVHLAAGSRLSQRQVQREELVSEAEAACPGLAHGSWGVWSFLQVTAPKCGQHSIPCPELCPQGTSRPATALHQLRKGALFLEGFRGTPCRHVGTLP